MRLDRRRGSAAAGDGRVPVENSLDLHDAPRRLGVSTELHVLPRWTALPTPPETTA